MIKKTLLALTFLFFHAALFAQDGGITMADQMRSNGKIYVVVAVLLIILLGLIIYLIRIDRKMTRLERQTYSSFK